MILKVLIVALILKLDIFVIARSVGKSEKSVERLKNNYESIEYSLMFLEINVQDRSFVCIESLSFKLLEATNELFFHAKNIDITKASISYPGLPNTTNIDIISMGDTEFAKYKHDAIIPSNRKVELVFQVRGEINDDVPEGLYVKSYIEGGEKKDLLLSNFAPNYARSAFLSFDEPNYQSSISIVIDHDDTLTALSNSYISFTHTVPKIRTSFDEIEKISTSSIALFISDFQNVSDIQTSENREFFQQFSARGIYVDYYDEALNRSIEILKLVEKYLSLEFSMQKLDSTAIPDLGKRFMSFQGLIFYDEFPLYFDKENSPSFKIVSILNSITGAIVQQHFGNVLKPDWWNSQWILSAISKFCETFAIEELDFELEKLSFVNDVLESMRTKLLRSVQHDITLSSDIDNVFEESLVIRASCILKMISYGIGEVTFQKGLQAFAKTESNVIKQSDFYGSLQAIYDSEIGGVLKIEEIIESWVTKPDVPVMNVERVYGSPSVKLVVNGEPRWMPFNYRHKLSPQASPIDWFDQNEKTIEIPDIEDDSWILFNLDQIGFYRVNYDTRNWDLIKILLQSDHNRLLDKTRAQLIDDSFSLSRSGDLRYAIAFDLMNYLRNDLEFLPWKAAVDNLRPLSWLMYKTAAFSNFTIVMQNLVKPLVEHVTYDEMPEENFLDMLNRPLLISWACEMSLSGCLEATKSKLLSFLQDSTAIPANLRSLILCNGLRSSTSDEFDLLMSKLKNDINLEERFSIIDGLGCFDGDAQIYSLLELVATSSATEQLRVILSVINGNMEGYKVAIKYLLGNYAKIKKSNWPTITFEISKRISDDDNFGKLKQILELSKINADDRILIGNIVQSNIDWLTQDFQNDISEWLVNDLENSITEPPETSSTTSEESSTTSIDSTSTVSTESSSSTTEESSTTSTDSTSTVSPESSSTASSDTSSTEESSSTLSEATPTVSSTESTTVITTAPPIDELSKTSQVVLVSMIVLFAFVFIIFVGFISFPVYKSRFVKKLK